MLSPVPACVCGTQFTAMGIIAAEMFENDAPILQMDKLIRRIETSGGSRAKKWFDRAEKSFANMAYEDALKDFLAVARKQEGKTSTRAS